MPAEPAKIIEHQVDRVGNGFRYYGWWTHVGTHTNALLRGRYSNLRLSQPVPFVQEIGFETAGSAFSWLVVRISAAPASAPAGASNFK